jgi:hypothetical protein
MRHALSKNLSLDYPPSPILSHSSLCSSTIPYPLLLLLSSPIFAYLPFPILPHYPLSSAILSILPNPSLPFSILSYLLPSFPILSTMPFLLLSSPILLFSALPSIILSYPALFLPCFSQANIRPPYRDCDLYIQQFFRPCNAVQKSIMGAASTMAAAATAMHSCIMSLLYAHARTMHTPVMISTMINV